MKPTMITEILIMNVLPSVSEEQILAAIENINLFIRAQDGFIDAELVSPLQGTEWHLIYHIESMEKVKAVGEKIRMLKLFDAIAPFIEPGSMQVSFHNHLKKW